LLVGTVVPFALGIALASLLSNAFGSTSGDTFGLQRMWSEGSRLQSAAWVLTISLLPGFVEETFYRGLIQRGLLMRWRPAAAIATSSLLFAISHGDLIWAIAILPLGIWLGLVAWRTGSVLLCFAIHASVNGLWTVGMMVLHREPASQTALNWIALSMIAIGVVVFPVAIAVLKTRATPTPYINPAPDRRLLPSVAISGVLAAALVFAFVPPGTATTHPSPTLGDVEASAGTTVACTTIGEHGAIEFHLTPGEGIRVALPPSDTGVAHLTVMLDQKANVVWLAYAGELTGKGTAQLPSGILEQLASGNPCVLCMSFTPLPTPVVARLWLECEESRVIEADRRAQIEGWATRRRR
jgi:hypothetical protein